MLLYHSPQAQRERLRLRNEELETVGLEQQQQVEKILPHPAPTWKGDLSLSKRGPKGDPILSEKGTKRGPSATEKETKWGPKKRNLIN